MFGAFFAYRDRPLPDLAPLRARLTDAKALPIDVTDKRSPDPLIALTAKGVKGRNYYASVRNPPYWQKAEGAVDELWARTSVVDKLAMVNARLAEMGLRLHVFDAWRPLAVQAFFHDVWVPKALRNRRPDLSGEEIAREVSRYWAAASADPAHPSPHCELSGRVVALFLRRSNVGGADRAGRRNLRPRAAAAMIITFRRGERFCAATRLAILHSSG